VPFIGSKSTCVELDGVVLALSLVEPADITVDRLASKRQQIVRVLLVN